MDFEMGSIVTIDNYQGQYVITGMENHEDYGSNLYNRDYYVMKLEDMENKDYVIQNEGIKIQCRTAILHLHKVENIAPFRLTKEVRYKVDRMKAKTITIYE